MDSAKEPGTSDVNLEISCDPCGIFNEHVIAVCYCGECDEYLCKTCSQFHHRLGATRDHVVKEDHDLPKTRPSEGATIDLPEKCLVHTDQLLDRYCNFHEELCCGICLSRAHYNCEDVISLPEYSKTVDMAKELDELNLKMAELVDEVNDTLCLVQTNLKAVELNLEIARSKMLEMKTSALALIEEKYDTLNEELNKLTRKDLNKIQPCKKKCDAIKFDLNAVESYLKSSTKKDKHQLFLAVTKAKLKVSSNRADLQDIRHGTVLNATRYRFDPNSQLTQLKSNLNSFGKFTIQDSAIKSAKLDKSLHACETGEDGSCCVTGLAVLTENTLVVADYKNKTVKLIDIKEDNILSEVSLESAPWDVTAVSDKQVAVTVPDKEKVNILSVSENNTLHNLPDKEIVVNQKCFGVTFSKDKLFLTIRQPPTLEVYSFANGKLVLSVKLDKLNPEYITINSTKSKLFISDNSEGGCIKELDIDDLKETDALKSCRDEVIGMAVDKTGVLYYCDSYYHAVDAVCIEKRQGCNKERTALISKFKNHPKCLAFNDETNRLFVGMDGTEIAVYYVV